MKIIILSLLMLCLAGCQPSTPETARHQDNQAMICIKGVIYYQYDRSIAPAYKTDGTLILCPKEHY